MDVGKNVPGAKVERVEVKSASATAVTIIAVAASNIGRDVAARIFMGLEYDDAVSCGLLNSRWKAWFDYFLAHASTKLRLHTNKLDEYGLPKRSVDFLNFTRTQSLVHNRIRLVDERKEIGQNESKSQIQNVQLSIVRFNKFSRFVQLIGSCCGRLQSLAIEINLSNLSNGTRTIALICSNCPKLQSLSLSISAESKVLTSAESIFADISPTTLSTFFHQLTELKLVRGPLEESCQKDDTADPVAIFVTHLVALLNDAPGELMETSFSSLKKLTLELVDLKSESVWLGQRQLWMACVNVEELTWRILSATKFSSIRYYADFDKLQRLHFSNWLIVDAFEFFSWIAAKLSLVHLTLENISIENIRSDYYAGSRTDYRNHLLILDLGKQLIIDHENSRFLDDFILLSPHLVSLTFSLHTNFESDLLSNNSEHQWTRSLLAKLKLLKDLRHLTIHLTRQDQIPFVHRIIQNHLSPFPPAFELNLLVVTQAKTIST